MKILLEVRRAINRQHKTNAWEFCARAKIINDQINQLKVDKSSIDFHMSLCLSVSMYVYFLLLSVGACYYAFASLLFSAWFTEFELLNYCRCIIYSYVSVFAFIPVGLSTEVLGQSSYAMEMKWWVIR